MTNCALIHSVSDLKATQMNEQCSLIQKLRIYTFTLGHNAAEAKKKKKKTFVVRKVKMLLIIARMVEEISLELHEPHQSGKVRWAQNYEFFGTVHQAININGASSNRRVSGEVDISQSSVVHHLHDLDKSIRSCGIAFHFTKIWPNFGLTLFFRYHTSSLMHQDGSSAMFPLGSGGGVSGLATSNPLTQMTQLALILLQIPSRQLTCASTPKYP